MWKWYIRRSENYAMKNLLLPVACLVGIMLDAQVPANGVTADAQGNIFVAMHAPARLVYDGWALPISKLRSNYIMKLDSNGNLTAIKHVNGIAAKAGPLKIKGDTLLFAQGSFHLRKEGSTGVKGEIVLTKMSTEMDKFLTVTIPMPVYGRPLAVAYEKNYWYVAYAFLSQNSSRTKNKPYLALAGIRHNYSDGWIKQLSARNIHDLWLHDEKLWCLGTYAYTLRWGKQKRETEGIDFFAAEVNRTSGEALSIQHGNTGQVLHVARYFMNQDHVIGGSVLVEGQEQNREQLFIGKIGEGNTATLLAKADNLNNSIIFDFMPLADGGYIALANFNGSLKLGDVQLKSRGGQDVCVIRFNSAGKVVWLQRLGTTLNDEAIALAKSSDDSFVVAYQKRDMGYADVLSSFIATMPPYGEVELLKIDITGAVLWKKSIEAMSAE
jgi:hypothetical protein